MQRARWVWMTQPEVSAMVETMVKPLCGNSDFYFKAFAHKVCPAKVVIKWTAYS
jgi:hypothetical protein